MNHSWISLIMSASLLLGAGAPAAAAGTDDLVPVMQEVSECRSLAVYYAVCAAVPLMAVSALLGNDLADGVDQNGNEAPASPPRPADDRGFSGQQLGIAKTPSQEQMRFLSFEGAGGGHGRYAERIVSTILSRRSDRGGADIASRISPSRLARGAIDPGVTLPQYVRQTL